MRRHAVAEFMDGVVEKSVAQFEFHRAVHEVVGSMLPLLRRYPK